jgi:hypothetical protein
MEVFREFDPFKQMRAMAEHKRVDNEAKHINQPRAKEHTVENTPSSEMCSMVFSFLISVSVFCGVHTWVSTSVDASGTAA